MSKFDYRTFKKETAEIWKWRQEIRTKAATEAYREGYDRIFRKNRDSRREDIFRKNHGKRVDK